VIIISPVSRPLPDGRKNVAKDYPFWPAVVAGLAGHKLVQIGLKGEPVFVEDFRFNLPLREVKDLAAEAETWISVDNFFPHLCNLIGKRGVVIWSQSDPRIFGYTQNVNLLRSREYLRANQFDYWGSAGYVEKAFVQPEVVVDAVRALVGRPELG